jgi:hypothetical protein
MDTDCPGSRCGRLVIPLVLFVVGALVGLGLSPLLEREPATPRTERPTSVTVGDLRVAILSDRRTVRADRLLVPALGRFSPRVIAWTVDIRRAMGPAFDGEYGPNGYFGEGEAWCLFTTEPSSRWQGAVLARFGKVDVWLDPTTGAVTGFESD